MEDLQIVDAIERAIDKAIDSQTKYMDLKHDTLHRRLTDIDNRIIAQNGSVKDARKRIGELEKSQYLRGEQCPKANEFEKFHEVIDDVTKEFADCNEIIKADVVRLKLEAVTKKDLGNYMWRLYGGLIALLGAVIGVYEFILT
jgi:hypothetical protein